MCTSIILKVYPLHRISFPEIPSGDDNNSHFLTNFATKNVKTHLGIKFEQDMKKHTQHQNKLILLMEKESVVWMPVLKIIFFY